MPKDPDKDIEEVYTPFGYSDYQTIVANINRRWQTAVVSTINGDSNVPFYKELANRGLKATDVPVVAFSVGKRSCAASIPNRWSATSRHGTTLNPSIIRPTKPSSPIIARMPKRTSCRMPIRW